MALNSYVDSMNFADQANIRNSYKEVMSLIRIETIHICSKYKIQIKPIQFEWDKFLPILKKDFPEI